MQPALSLLLADLGDVLSSLAPIIFVVLYGIAHLVGNFQQEKKKAAARPRPVQRPQEFRGAAAAPPAKADGNQPNLEETLRREVEEFLRRAQGGEPKQQKPAPARPGQQRAPQRPAQKRPSLQPTRSAGAPQQPIESPRRLVETRQPEPAAPITPFSESRPSLSQTPLSTGAALRSQTVLHYAQTLGVEVAQADERMEEHLRQTFTHQLGAIAPRQTAAAGQVAATSAQELRRMLSRPESVRQLIIASEILRRPEIRLQ